MALYCNPISGNIFKRVCALTKGGLQGVIYATNLSQIDTVTVANGEVTAITMKQDATPADYPWYQIVPKKNTSGLDNIVVKGTNSKYFNQVLDFQVEGMDTDNKNAFESLIDGQAVFICKDSSGTWHMVGHETGAEIQDGARIGTGIELDSLVGGQAQFIAEEVFVTPTVQAGITIPVVDEDGVTINTVTL